MTHDNPSKTNAKPRGRLSNPTLRYASILVAIMAICTLLYSIANSLPIIPIIAGIFFLMLWFWPSFWKLIEYIFSKRPSSILGRFTLNLVLAIIMASALEDVLEIVLRFARIIFWTLRRLI